MQFLEHGVGRAVKRCAVVLDAFQVTGITCQCEGNQHKVRLVQTTSHILLQRLTKADGQLLRGVHRDTLRSIRHEGVRQSAVDDGTNKLVGVQYTWINHYGHGLHITNLLDEGTQVLIGHLGRNQGVAQHTAVD